MEMKFRTETAMRIVAIQTACAASGIDNDEEKRLFGQGFRAAMDGLDMSGPVAWHIGYEAGQAYLDALELIKA